MRVRLFFLVLMVINSSSLFSNTILFQDDFEDGNASDWEYESGWQVTQEDTNYVFEGSGHNWAIPPVDLYNNVTFQAKIKLVSGGFHLNILFRSGRYYIPIHPNFVQFFNDEIQLNDIDITVAEGVWHDVKVMIENNHLEFFLNETMLFEYNDPNRPILFGKLAFECINHIYLDDILVTGSVSYDQKATWVRTGGPLGGIGYDVRVDFNDPNIIYVTDQWAGCHKSYDGGKTWHPRNTGINSRFGPTADSVPIFCLTIDPNDPNIVWCGTFGMRGVYKSTDKAESWKLKANGIPDTERLTFRSFAVQPGNSDVVYCGVEWSLWDDEIPAGQKSASQGKIYKTEDGGENWREVLISDALVRTIIIDPTNTDIVYEMMLKKKVSGKARMQVQPGCISITVLVI
jgi:hypothetical protein